MFERNKALFSRSFSPGQVVGTFVSLMLFTLWEVVNYKSTQESVFGMFGGGVVIAIFGAAVVATDGLYLLQFIIAGIKAVQNRTKVRDELRDAKFGAMTAVAWAVLTAFDTLLTWFWLAVLMENNIAQGNLSAPGSIVDYLWLFPVAIAIMTWSAQAVLLTTLGRVVGDITRSVYGVARAQRASVSDRNSGASPTRNATTQRYPPVPPGLEPPPAEQGFPFSDRVRYRNR